MAEEKVVQITIPDGVTDLTRRICEQATKQAQEEYLVACKKAADILTPFFNGIESATVRELVSDSFGFSWNTVYENTNRGKKVPTNYVKTKCDAALVAFLEKVNTLQDQLDDLQNQIEEVNHVY